MAEKNDIAPLFKQDSACLRYSSTIFSLMKRSPALRLEAEQKEAREIPISAGKIL